MENLFETLVDRLRKGIVSFVYRKKDGTERGKEKRARYVQSK